MRLPTVLVFLATLVPACGVEDAKSPERERFDCKVDVLKPAVDHALDAADLVRRIAAGDIRLDQVLEALKTPVAQAEAVARDFHACDAEPVPADAGAPE